MENIDVFIPESSYSLLSSIDFKDIVKIFPSIMIHNKDGSILQISYSDKKKTLHIKPITSTVSFEMIMNSLNHIVIDYQNQNQIIYQSIIDTLSQFHQKVIWSSDNSHFYKTLSKYTTNYKTKNLTGYKWKKSFPLFNLDTIIKLGIIAPECKDIFSIIRDKTSFETKNKKVKELLLKLL